MALVAIRELTDQKGVKEFAPPVHIQTGPKVVQFTYTRPPHMRLLIEVRGGSTCKEEIPSGFFLCLSLFVNLSKKGWSLSLSSMYL
jgi:hypothetical protein